MADKVIGDLNYAPGTVDDGNTLFVVQQAGAAYKLDGHAFILALTSILDGHGGIASIVYTAPVSPSLDGTLTITLADQSVTTLTVKNGKGIVSIAKTGSSGLTDVYTISYNDGTTSSFTVTNGAKGDTGDAWYVWIRYAGQQPTQDSDIGTTPDNWMGIYSGTSSTAPTHYADYQWFEIKGEKGDTGDPATVDSTEIVYQGSASGTTVPIGEWSTTIPVVPQGQYLWTRTTVTFNIGNPVVWYSVSYIAVDGSGSPGTATPLVDSGAGSVGTAMSYSRQDHQHPLNVATTGTPQMDGTASRGSEPTYARSDHIHPHDTSKADTGLGITGATVGKVPVISAVDGNGVPTAFVAGDGGDVTADMLGIVIDGNSTPVGASKGQYVIVKNSTISGVTDGLYKAALAIPANTAIDATYLTAVSGGGLNDVTKVEDVSINIDTTKYGLASWGNVQGTLVGSLLFIRLQGFNCINDLPSLTTIITLSGYKANASITEVIHTGQIFNGTISIDKNSGAIKTNGMISGRNSYAQLIIPVSAT